MREKYIYWAPEIFGKNQACGQFEFNGLTALKYFGHVNKRDTGVFEWGEMICGLLYRRSVKLSALDDNTTSVDVSGYYCVPTASVPSVWAGNYVFDNQEHIDRVREKYKKWNDSQSDIDWYHIPKYPEATKVPDYIDPGISVIENIQRVIDIGDPDLICTMDLLSEEPININLKKYKHYLPYKSQGYKYLLLDRLISTPPSQLKDFIDVENVFKHQLKLFKGYMKYLSSQGCTWDWIDISDDNEYKNKFKLEKTLDFIVNDPRWLDPIIITDKTKEYVEIVDKYFDKHYNMLNAFFPKVLS